MEESKTTAPSLLDLVLQWFKASKREAGFHIVSNRFSCKTCSVIVMKVLKDRVRLAKGLKGKYEPIEILAADPKLFEVIESVFSDLKHNNPKCL